MAIAIINSDLFENLIIVAILIAAVQLAADDPLEPEDSLRSQILSVVDNIFSLVFALEALIKIIALGFVVNYRKPKEAYILNSWNILDFTVVCSSGVDLFDVGSGGLKSLKALRAIRGLRPLRVIGKNRNLKLIVGIMFNSAYPLFIFILILLLSLTGFTIIGIGWYENQLHYCSINSHIVRDEQTCLLQSEYLKPIDGTQQHFYGKWLTPHSNFNNYMNGLLTTFILATGEGYRVLFHLVLDARPSNPEFKDNKVISYLRNGVFMATMIIFSGIVFQKIFICVVVANYLKTNESQSGAANSNIIEKGY